jgi:hypothetical protein
MNSYRKIKSFIVAIAACALATSCQHINPSALLNSGTMESINNELKTIQTNTGQLQTDNAALKEAIKQFQQSGKDTLQFLSDRVYSIDYYNTQNPVQNGNTLLIGKEILPAKALLPPPSDAALKTAINNLILQNNTLQTDKDKLQQNYATLQLQAAALKGQNDEKTSQLQAAQAKVDASVSVLAKNTSDLALAAAQADQLAKSNAEAQKEADKQAAAKARIAVASKFMIVGGIICALAIAAAFLHAEAVLWPGLAGGGSLLGIGWLILYIENLMQQPWFKYSVGGVILFAASCLVWIGFKAYETRKKAKAHAALATNLLGIVQEVKNDDVKNGTHVFDTIAPYWNEWMVDDHGNPDSPLLGQIEDMLVKMNLINPKPAVGVIPSPTPVPVPTHTAQPASGSMTPASGSLK